MDDPARYAKVTLPLGKPPSGKPGEEPVPFPPNDPHRGDQFADRVKALLRRHVVERCIYGVDLNPLRACPKPRVTCGFRQALTCDPLPEYREREKEAPSTSLQ